jgi:hypothetical protein
MTSQKDVPDTRLSHRTIPGQIYPLYIYIRNRQTNATVDGLAIPV